MRIEWILFSLLSSLFGFCASVDEMSVCPCECAEKMINVEDEDEVIR